MVGMLEHFSLSDEQFTKVIRLQNYFKIYAEKNFLFETWVKNQPSFLRYL